MGNGFGMMAFASLVGESIVRAAGARDRTAASTSRKLDHPARAKRVIFLFMNGGLSQVDSFDPKPMLDKYHGQPLPGGTVATERKTGALMRSPFTFKKYGQCGMEVSELFPHVGECADDICFIRSMYTDIPNHEPSMLMMNTGHTQVGRPSLGSWLTYGLGTENKNLPGYVVLCPDVPTTVGPPLWNSAFLPAVHQGTFIADKVEKQTDGSVGKDFDPKKLISYIHNDKFTLPEQRRELDLLEHARTGCSMQREPVARSAARGGDPVDGDRLPDADRGAGRVRHPQGERGDAEAVRPRQHGARLPDGRAPGRARRAHGAGLLRQGRSVGRARRHPGAPQEREGLRPAVRRGDQGSEVTRPVRGHAGRLRLGVRPHAGDGSRRRRRQTQNGRDHNPFGFTMWLAGGGVKGGTIYGATDDFGFKAVEKPVHVHDLHATILHLLGIDHTKLTYRYSGRDFRLTDVSGNVIHDIIA